MNKSAKAIMAAGMALALGGTLYAGVSLAHGGFHKGHGHGPRGEMLFEQFDRNQDGRITQDEVAQVRQQRFSQFDGDGDGKLTLQEYDALWHEMMRERMIRMFQRLDRDGDAGLTAEEVERPLTRMFEHLDRNEDGAITRDELKWRKGPRYHHDDE